MKNKLSINELCYSTLSSDKPNSFDTYVSQGGYGTWKKIIKDEFSNTAGISIKYYGYNELATITLVNKDLFPIYNNR